MTEDLTDEDLREIEQAMREIVPILMEMEGIGRQEAVDLLRKAKLMFERTRGKLVFDCSETKH